MQFGVLGPKSRSFRCVIIDTDAISNGIKVLQYQGIVIMNQIVDTCIGNCLNMLITAEGESLRNLERGTSAAYVQFDP